MNKEFLKIITCDDNAEQTMEDICVHVANGGSLIDLCRMWKIRFGDLNWWVNKDANRKKQLEQAMIAQVEWAMQRILTELRAIAFDDISEAFNADHTLKPINEWPDTLRRKVSGIEVDEIFQGYGDNRKYIGLTKKIKLADKIRAIELMMKNLNMLTERTMNLHGTTDDKDFRDEFFGIKKQE